MARLHKNKRILDKEILVLEEKGGLAGKTQETWRRMKWTPLRRTEIGSCGCWKRSDSLEKKHAVWKELTWQTRWSRRISTPIRIWEHHLGKVWNQHLTSKQLEYHNSNQNKGLACRISQRKHMTEISTEVFVVGPTRARSYITIMYKAVHMTYEASPSRHSQGLFKTLRDHSFVIFHAFTNYFEL